MSALAQTIGSFGRVLETRDARQAALGGLVGRFREAGTGLALILATRGGHASFAVAGLASAAYLAGEAVARPAHGRWVDRSGPRVALLVGSTLNALLLLGVAVAAWRGGSPWLIVALGVAVGVTLPALSAALRAMWPQLAPGEIEPAYALDTLGYELSLIASPALVGVIAVAASPALAVVVIAVLGMAGSVAVATVGPGRSRPEHHPGARPPISRPVLLLIAISLLVGAAEGAMTVLAPGVASAHHDHGASGLLLATFSAGSLLGAVAYSAVGRRGSLAERLVAATGALTAGFALLALLGTGVAGFALLAALVGVALSPALTIGFVALREVAAAETLTEAFTWASFAAAAGASGSQALAGVLISGPGVATALWIPAAIAAAATIASLLALRTPALAGPRPAG